MGKDYYEILRITRSAKDADIKKAYRKLALKFHPLKNTDDPTAEDRFYHLAEAYDVLSDARKRAVYDQFGEEGLKAGVPAGTIQAGAWTQGYVFHGSPEKVFHEFFGGDNPFQEFYDRVDGDMSMGFGGLHGRGKRRKDEAVERDLNLTLEEVYHGCLKKMQIRRRVMNEDGHTSSIREKILVITVKKGWKPGTRITFPEEGDQGPNTVPADIVFVVKDKPHARFRRDGSDLIYTAKLSLCKALTNCVLEIQTLDERTLHIPVNEVIRPGVKKIIPNEGMPITHTKDEYGSLIIEFEVEFPAYLTPEQKEYIKTALNFDPKSIESLGKLSAKKRRGDGERKLNAEEGED